MAGVFVIAVLGTMALGLLSKWVDRKVTARVQWRAGPPLLQPLIDIIKLLGKETIVPRQARRTGFLLAPVIGFAAVCAAAALLWAANIAPEWALNSAPTEAANIHPVPREPAKLADLILVWYLLMVPSIALIIGGASSANPHGVIGASREMKLMLSYELPLLLAMLTAVVAGNYTLSLGELIQSSAGSLWTKIAMAVAFLVGVLCTQAKLGLVPFDIAEAETEIMGGVYVEYSGPPLALFLLTRAMMFALMPIFLVTVFWGGFHGTAGLLLGIPKYLLVVVLMVLIRNTNPRVRIDQAMRFFWYGLTPIALGAVAVAVAVM
jgi:NADH-quinone oxidoreductase subunit H